MKLTFVEYLLTEGDAGTTSNIRRLIGLFLSPIADDETKLRKRILLGLEVIHKIEDSFKHSVKFQEDDFDETFFNEMREDAHDAVNDLLAPPSSERVKRAKFKSMASQFNRYIVNPMVDAISVGNDESEVRSLVDDTVEGVIDQWNTLTRQLEPEEASDTRQMQRKYSQARKRTGRSTKQATYRGIERQARR